MTLHSKAPSQRNHNTVQADAGNPLVRICGDARGAPSRLSYLRSTLIACRYPEITEEELNRRPEDEEITVDILNNDDYLPRLEKLFRRADRSIYVVMFICNPGKSRSDPVNELLDELIRARKRGVRVRVILDKSQEEDDFGAEANEKAYQKLKREGLDVEYDYPKIKTHDKLLVIDEEYTVIGAHNWTDAALTDQNESAILIKSEAVAKDYIKYFYQLHDQTARFVKMGW